MSVESPCIDVCVLDEDNVCIGCKRTEAEVGYWSHMTDVEKITIISRIEEEK